MDDEQERESGLRALAKSGRKTTISGCAVAIGGVLLPLILLQFAVAESGFGWQVAGLFLFLTPVMGIAGIVLFFVGMAQTSNAERELGEDSDRSPDLNW